MLSQLSVVNNSGVSIRVPTVEIASKMHHLQCLCIIIRQITKGKQPTEYLERIRCTCIVLIKLIQFISLFQLAARSRPMQEIHLNANLDCSHSMSKKRKYSVKVL